MALLQVFAWATTAQLSGHVQTLVGISSSELGWEQNEIAINSELQWKKLPIEWFQAA